MNPYIEGKKAEFENVIEHTKKEFSSIRTGRAAANMIEDIQVEAYGSRTPLKHLASIGVSDASSMTVEPFDKSLIKDIEKAMSTGNKGFTVANEGQKLRVRVPALTQENRKELVKLLGEKTEKGKVQLRQVRDDIKNAITEAHKNKEIPEDAFYAYKEELDKITKEYTAQIDEMKKQKEEHLMAV